MDRHLKVIKWIKRQALSEETKDEPVENYQIGKALLKDGALLCELLHTFDVDADKIPYEKNNNDDIQVCLSNLRLFTDALLKFDTPSEAQFGPASLLSDDDDELKEVFESLTVLVVWAIKKYNLKDEDGIVQTEKKSVSTIEINVDPNSDEESSKKKKDSTHYKKMKLRNKARTQSSPSGPTDNKRISISKRKEQKNRLSTGNTQGVPFVRPDGSMVYGLDAEIAWRLEAKRDVNFEEKVLKWIEDVTSCSILGGEEEDKEGDVEFDPYNLDILRDGQILCKLANCIQPDIIKRFNKQDHELAYLENVKEYINALKKMGAPLESQFTPEMLMKKTDLNSVIMSISTLARWCDDKEDIDLPRFEEQKELTEEQKIRRAPSKKWNPVQTKASFKRTWKNSDSTDSDDPDYIDPSLVVNHCVYKGRDGKELYGDLAQLAKKEEAKRDPQEEKIIIQWIKDVVGQKAFESYLNKKLTFKEDPFASAIMNKINKNKQETEAVKKRENLNFIELIEDGILLIMIVNTACRKRNQGEDVIPKHNAAAHFMAYEANYKLYFKACKDHLGLKAAYNFPIDAIRKGNVGALINNIHAVAEKIEEFPEYDGPLLITVQISGTYDVKTDVFVPDSKEKVSELRKKKLQEKTRKRTQILAENPQPGVIYRAVSGATGIVTGVISGAFLSVVSYVRPTTNATNDRKRPVGASLSVPDAASSSTAKSPAGSPRKKPKGFVKSNRFLQADKNQAQSNKSTDHKIGEQKWKIVVKYVGKSTLGLFIITLGYKYLPEYCFVFLGSVVNHIGSFSVGVGVRFFNFSENAISYASNGAIILSNYIPYTLFDKTELLANGIKRMCLYILESSSLGIDYGLVASKIILNYSLYYGAIGKDIALKYGKLAVRNGWDYSQIVGWFFVEKALASLNFFYDKATCITSFLFRKIVGSH